MILQFILAFKRLLNNKLVYYYYFFCILFTERAENLLSFLFVLKERIIFKKKDEKFILIDSPSPFPFLFLSLSQDNKYRFVQTFSFSNFKLNKLLHNN